MWNPIADADGDGIITSKEMRDLLDLAYHQLDADADGLLSRTERNNALNLIQQGKITEFKIATPAPSGRYALENCQLPPVSQDAEIVFIRGYQGAAQTDVAFDKSDSPVSAMDLNIPTAGPDLYIIASFHDATVIRLSGETDRVKTLVTTRGDVGVSGAQHDIKFGQANACHIIWDESLPDIDVEFERAFSTKIGRPPKSHIGAYYVGSANLETRRNKNKTQLAGAQTPKGAAWNTFHQYAPGGLLKLDPSKIQSPAVVTKRTVLPASAGIASLIENGALVLVSGGQVVDFASEARNGNIQIGAKTYSPKTGADAIFVDGIKYTEIQPRKWAGKKPEVYLVTRPFELPVGLYGAHAVRLLLPQGMEAPSGALGHSKLKRLDQNAADTVDWGAAPNP